MKNICLTEYIYHKSKSAILKIMQLCEISKLKQRSICNKTGKNNIAVSVAEWCSASLIYTAAEKTGVQIPNRRGKCFFVFVLVYNYNKLNDRRKLQAVTQTYHLFSRKITEFAVCMCLNKCERNIRFMYIYIGSELTSSLNNLNVL